MTSEGNRSLELEILLSLRKHKFENEYMTLVITTRSSCLSQPLHPRIYTGVTTRGLVLRPDATATTIGLAISIYWILKRIKGGVVGYSTHRVIVLFGVRPVRHKE